AVIVKDGNIVGQGFTQPPGFAHAEIMALSQAREKAKGAVMYVTLEPCCHYGRTLPCTRALVAAGISEVHLATIDPNPLVSGKGKEELEKNGIRTFTGEHEDDVKELIEAYTKYITTGMPFITAKFAMSLDGKIATRSGDSKWISGEESRRFAHNLRCSNDAIMVGANTILADDPQLTIRSCSGRGGTVKKQPLRVIVDGRGRVPTSALVFHEPGETVVAVGKPIAAAEEAAFIRAGAKLMELPANEGLVDMRKLLEALGKRGITSILVEGGGILLGSLFDLGLIDKIIIFIAPIIIGGSKARMAVAGNGVDKIVDSYHLEQVNIEKFGPDLMVSGYVKAH
ncbi:MAG: bifunctional diaminohydroxyphosphoribosylaminopyrimidine deaminase/5-amino-6-(5-phosphoribosylamino)uracil reductase RibD, partial [Chloroflexota bacterium]